MFKDPEYFDENYESKVLLSEKQKEDIRQLNRDFFNCFNSDNGKRVLDYFKKYTIYSPCWQLGQPENQAVFREGQNSIIREIDNRIENAKNED